MSVLAAVEVGGPDGFVEEVLGFETGALKKDVMLAFTFGFLADVLARSAALRFMDAIAGYLCECVSV